MGRPSEFTQEKADAICLRLIEGESLRSICKDEGMPGASTVFQWLAARPEFAEQYARAREAQADHLAEEILSIADDGTNDTYQTDNGEAVNHEVVQRSKLRVDARKWLAAKMAPKKYGDKITQEHTGPNGGPVQIVATEHDQNL
jgi:hypothetical protein